MITTVSIHDFREAFDTYNPMSNFSYDGLAALFDYLEDMEDALHEQRELDVISLCCAWTEYDSLAEYQAGYGAADYPTMEDIEDNTIVIYIDGKDGFMNDGTDGFIALDH
jgi:hypothetical protein